MNKFWPTLTAILTISVSTGASAITLSAAAADQRTIGNRADFAAAERALEAFAASPAINELERLSQKTGLATQIIFDERDLPFSEEEQGAVQIGIIQGEVFVVSRNDGGSLPNDFFVNPISPVVPDQIDGSEALATPLPAAAPLLLAGLAGFAFSIRRRRSS